MINTEQVRSFQTAGYAVLPGMFSGAVCERLRSEASVLLRRLVAHMDDTGEVDPRVTWWRLPTGEPYVFKIKPVLDLAPTAQAVARDGKLLDAVGRLLGGSPVLMENKITYKQRVTVERPWSSLRLLGEQVCKHSDAAYFHARGFRDPIATVAVCLDDVPAGSGPVRVWPGSHLQSLPHLPTPDHGPVVPDAYAPDEGSVPLVAATGSVLIWDARLVHASGPNTTRNPRRLLVLGYAPATASPAHH